MLCLFSSLVSFEVEPVRDYFNVRNIKCIQFVLACVLVLVRLGGWNGTWTSYWKRTGGGWWPAAGGTWFAEEIIAVRMLVCVCLCRVSDWSWQRPLYCWLARRFSRPVLDTLIWIKCSSVSVGTRSGASPTLCPFTCFLHPPAHLEPGPPTSLHATPLHPCCPLWRPFPFRRPVMSCKAHASFGAPDGCAHVCITQSASVRGQHWGGRAVGRGLNRLSPLPHFPICCSWLLPSPVSLWTCSSSATWHIHVKKIILSAQWF